MRDQLKITSTLFLIFAVLLGIAFAQVVLIILLGFLMSGGESVTHIGLAYASLLVYGALLGMGGLLCVWLYRDKKREEKEK